MEFTTLDIQVASFSKQLLEDVCLRPDEVDRVASAIWSEVHALNQNTRTQILAVSPVPIGDRLEELKGFQGWMDFASSARDNPVIVRAQVIVQNYVCSVYLKESIFYALSKAAPDGSVVKRCCAFLTNGRIRSFRNALSHANWTYRRDFSGLVYWDKKKNGKRVEPMQKFEVDQMELDFWQRLSRAVAYAAFRAIDGTWTDGASG